MQHPLFNAHWNVKLLLRTGLLVALLVLSWRLQPTRAIWDSLDLAVFTWLNQPIAQSHTLALGWAILNMRPVDALFGLLLFSLILRGKWTVETEQVRLAFIAFICLLLWLVMIRIGFMRLLSVLEWSRASPTLVLPEAIKLSHLFPGWDTRFHLKDDSPISFPGDHASVLFIWAMFVSQYVSRPKHILVWGIAIALSVPRLAAGAHWVTDDVVGGLALALIAFSTATHTPLLAKCALALEQWTRPVWRLLKQIPYLGRLSVFKGL